MIGADLCVCPGPTAMPPESERNLAFRQEQWHFSLGEVVVPANAGTLHFATGKAALIKSPGIRLTEARASPGNTTPQHDTGPLISGNTHPYHNFQVDLLPFLGIGSTDKTGGGLAPPADRGPAWAILGHFRPPSGPFPIWDVGHRRPTGVPSGAIPTPQSDMKRHKMAQNGPGN